MTAFMRWLGCALVALTCAIHPSAFAVESTGIVVSQNFTASTAEIINPERSWYEWSGGSNGYLISYNGSTYGGVNSSGLNGTRGVGYSMALGLIDLSQFITTSTIPSAFLTELGNRFATVRAAGMKVVVRPVYNYDNNGCDASLSIILSHISQLKQLFRDNADVIAYAQAGFFGPYGEMWQGSCSTSRSDADRVALRDALLAAYHPRTTISWRYPANVITFYSSALGLSSLATGSGQSRIGIFNDCFLSNDQDTGTYSSLTDPKRTRVATDSNYVPFGGETCTVSGTQRKACSDILAEGAKYHLAYLNRSYDGSFYSAWSSGGCYAQVMRSMGYRFALDSISHQSTATSGQTITAYVYMHNEGWARIFSPRRVVVRLRSTGGTVTATGTSSYDLRLLAPQSTTQQQVPVVITTPAAGTYNVEVCMPDRWPSLASDVRYSVRPANADSPGAWNATTGCFVTGTQVIVS